MTEKIPRILSIAGSDSSGGAGIQADIKTATVLGAYAMTAITAVTAQDSQGLRSVALMAPALVKQQIEACLGDIGADAIKIGMLGSGAIAEAVAAALREMAPSVPIVLDPVLMSTSGTALLDEDGERVLRDALVPLAALITPNIPEATRLGGVDAAANAEAAAQALLDLGAKAALVKGGHGFGDMLVDTLLTRAALHTFGHVRRDTRHTHGTGCTLATAIAVGLAQGRDLVDAVTRAEAFVQRAIMSAPGFGRGRGPLDLLPRA